MSEIINNVSRVPDSSIDYYKAYRSKNFYKGTSFRFLGEWTLGEHYFNDEYLIDFVSYRGTLLACKKSHIATVSNIPDLIINERKEVTGVTSEVWNYAFSSLPAPEVTIDSVITGEPGSNANVEDVGEMPDVALKFTIPSGLSGAYAIHVGQESPIDFKNAHLDNKNIQAAYKYAEDMMWVDTTESSNNQAIQAVYTAFMQSGGTGTIDSFKSALKELINIKNKVSNIEEGATKTIVVDNITTDSSTSALSARQGVVLDNKITSTRNDLLSEMKDPASLADSLLYHKGDTVYDKNDVKLNPITEASKVATSADVAYNTQELLNIHVVDKLDQHDDAVITLTDNKVDKVTGKQLSQEDFTTILKDKLNSIETGANKTIVIDNLTTVSTTYALSAKQGNILLSLINSIKQFNIVKVDTLPGTGVANTLYLVPVTSSDTNNYFEEYLWIDSKWELIGTTKVDLTDYYTKEQVNTLLKSKEALPSDAVYMLNDGVEEYEDLLYPAGGISTTVGGVQTQEEFNQMILSHDDLLSYGVEIDSAVSSPILTRIGNINLHRSLPIQNKMRGCLLDDNGNVIEYLPTNDWTTATRDGSRGQVMVEIPNFYFKCTTEGTKSKISISEYPLAGYIQFFNSSIKNVYCSAYEASLQRSTLKLSSVVNTTTDYRGGDNNSSWDGTYRSLLGMPATYVSLTDFRNYARKRNANATSQWNAYVYTIHVMISWLFYIEYANLNSQDTYKPQLDVNGYRQGGLGDGVTTLNGAKWGDFNRYYPFIPCGYTDSLGNKTGVVSFTMPFEYDSNDSANYIGEYNAATAYVDGNYVSSGTSLYVCILASTGNAVTNTTYFTPVTRTTVNVPSYRGIENPFGHISKWTDGCKCMIQSDASGGISEFYVCDTPANFTSSGTTNYQLRGNLSRVGGFVKEVILGEYGDIMPLSVGGGSTKYFCDYSYTYAPASSIDERGVEFGGPASYGAYAGFGSAHSQSAPSSSVASFGSRLCFIP